jgi:putative ABC transport system substrate-binding protein
MNTPVIATVINHPASLNISEAQVGNNVKLSGTSYYIDVKEQLKLYRELFPGARKIGMIYDSKNPAGYLAEEPFLRKACATEGLDFASVGVDSANDLPQATQHLLEAGTNMIVIPTNNLIYDNLSPVVEVTNRNQVPVVSMSKQGVENGALAALYADTYDLGRQAAELAARILREDLDPREAGFQYARHPDYHHQPDKCKGAAIPVPPQRTRQGSDRHSLTLGQQRVPIIPAAVCCSMREMRSRTGAAGAVCRPSVSRCRPEARNRS